MTDASTNSQKFTLALEDIGGDAPLPPRAWCAQIVGLSANGRMTRAFLKGMRDYRMANSVGSRGVQKIYLLDPGTIYEISSPKSWRSTDRYFATVEHGEIRRMTDDEVRQCLAK